MIGVIMCEYTTRQLNISRSRTFEVVVLGMNLQSEEHSCTMETALMIQVEGTNKRMSS